MDTGLRNINGILLVVFIDYFTVIIRASIRAKEDFIIHPSIKRNDPFPLLTRKSNHPEKKDMKK